MTSEATARANAFVAERLPAARALGQRLATLIDDPEAFTRALRRGLADLADPVYAREQERIAPGSGAVFGVRNPLTGALAAALRRPLAQASAASALSLAQRLASEDEREARLFSLVALRRALPADPERSWQLLRRLAHGATEWISVDTLAELYSIGILAEPFRWAELEQLVYSQQRWERRLVGSTVATIPFRLPRISRADLAGTPALALVGQLIGDAETDVAKALSWALRSWTEVDLPAVVAFLRREAAAAAAAGDGHRAWVVRDALTAPRMPVDTARDITAQLAGVRRRPGAPATSVAAAVVAAFTGYGELSEGAASVQGDRQRLARGASA